jgi:hypothetical protein
MGNLKNKQKYAPCHPIQHSSELVESANSFGGEGCVDNVITDE